MPVDLLKNKRQVGGGAAPAPLGAPAEPATAPAPAAPQQRGSGFVSFDRYLDANRAGAQAMAQKVGDAVEQSGKTAAGAIQGAQDKFSTETQKAGLGYDPTKATTEEQARTLSGTTYTGPKTWEDAGVNVKDVTKATLDASGKVSALGTSGGIAALLREAYNGPSTAGGSLLDSALTGAAGGGRFQQLQTAYGDLTQRLTDAGGGAEKVFNDTRDATAKAADQYGSLADQLHAQEEERLAAAAARQRAFMAPRQRAGDYQDGMWSQNEADTLEDTKRGGRVLPPRNRSVSGGGTPWIHSR
jgi:hypothetical protein